MRLSVIGTPNFMEFASELNKEGVNIKEIEMGEDAENEFYISSELKEDSNEIEELDIEFPQIIEDIIRNEEKIRLINLMILNLQKSNIKILIYLKRKIIWNIPLKGSK